MSAPVQLAANTILPAWLVLPLSAVVMLVVAAHVLAVHSSDLALMRRRVRVVNGLLMLVLVAMLAYALGMAQVVDRPIADPSGTREFLVVWLMIIGLLAMVIALAVFDAMQTVASGVRVRRQLRAEMRSGMASDLADRRVARSRPSSQPRGKGQQSARR